ncbi:MAG: hydrolase [Pseudomonadota bacterium]
MRRFHALARVSRLAYEGGMSSPSASALKSAAVDRALEHLDAQNEAIAARTEAWSAINSGSYELDGLTRMRALIVEACGALPAKPELAALAPTQRVRPDGETDPVEHGASVRVRVRPDAPIQIALTGHYDTVFSAKHAFQKPWRAEADTMLGPGVADMKGGIAVMLAALETFEAMPGEKRVGYEVLLSPDEEIGSPASAALLAELGKRAQLGMTYEPAMAEGALVSSRKGSGNFSLVLRGQAAHVGRAFTDGRSAVIAAAEAAVMLNELNGQHEGVTFNVGAIDGGGPNNIVPDKAVLRFNVRAPDEASVGWAMDHVRCVCDHAGNRDGIKAYLHGGISRPPKPVTPPQQIMMDWVKSAASVAGFAASFMPSGGVCEGNNLAAAGCPNIDTLGPCGGNLHSDQEFVRISSFAERAKLSLLLLAGVNDGAFDVKELRK